MALRVDEVRGQQAFLELEQPWNDFCAEHGFSSFFVSHDWFRCCLAGLDDESRVVILLLRDRSSVVGIVPLLHGRTTWRMFPAQVFSLLQNQDTPFVDLLLARAYRTLGLTTMLDHLQRIGGWHLLAGTKLERATAAESLTQAFGGSPFLRVSGGCSPRLSLEGNWEKYWQDQPQRFKKTVRNIANRVERLGTVAIADAAAASSAGECIELFRTVASRSWKETLPISLTRNPGIARFFAALTTALHARSSLAFWVLRIDGVPVATEYHVLDGDTVYALRSDFDDRHREASPGAHLNAFIVRTYFERDIQIYDMGPGDSEYKRRWATGAREYDELWLFNRTPYARALYGLERWALPPLRRVRQRWRDGGEAAAPAGA